VKYNALQFLVVRRQCFDISYLGLVGCHSKHHSKMGFVKRTSKLLEGVRGHKEDLQGPKKAKQEDAKAKTRRAGKFLALQKPRRRTATRDTTEDTLLRAQKAATMAQGTVPTHETGTHLIGAFQKPRKVADTQRIPIVDDDDDDEEEEEEEEDEHENEHEHEQADEGSDDLYESESEGEVDESVVDDMHKLEESFKGISRKYRLINRIGEGDSLPHSTIKQPV
jgi:hypothetical protein